MGIYLGGFAFCLENTRMLLNLMLYAAGEALIGNYITDNMYTECAYYPKIGKLVVINNSDTVQTTAVSTERGIKTFTIDAYDQVTVDVL